MSNNDHTARPEAWEAMAQWAASRTDSPAADCILELRARVERLEQAQQPIPRYNLRFRGVDLIPPIDCPDPLLWIAEQVYEQATASVICPHIVSSDEGTSYCGLAEGNSSAILTSSPPAPSTPAGQGELMSLVADAVACGCGGDWTPEARAAIFAVAYWQQRQGLHAAADLLRREVGR